MNILHFVLPLLMGSLAFGAPAEDLITSLPGLEFPINFNQYSGYLNGTTGRQLHYWFVESQADPLTDPLVLWLNGGPGCSSLMGFFTELGPFKISDDGLGTLTLNIYSWNQAANVIFLESPACVGFSYDENNNCATGDKEVADMNYLALQHFFQKFPEYDGRSFFITGESYAGIYIPTLAMKVVEGQATFPVNFQGYAIGNGLLSYENNDNSLLFFAYYHAILGESLWQDMVKSCCTGGIEGQEFCNFTGNALPACQALVLDAFVRIYNEGLNVYNLYGDCLYPVGDLKRNEYNFDVANLFRKFSKQIQGLPETYSDPPCTDNSIERNYLARTDVRDAIHIPPTVQAWDVCSDEVGNLYGRDYDATTPQIAFLQSSGIRGLIYNGDVDMAVNFLGNEWDVGTLGLTALESRRKWVVRDQVAGYVDRYPNLDFVTVRGSGHMVPEDKPEEALHMITSFFDNTPY